MKRSTLAMLLCLAVPPAFAQEEAPPRDDRELQLQQIEEIKQLLQQLHGQELPAEQRREIENRIREMLINQQIDRHFDEAPEPGVQIRPGGGLTIQGRPAEIEVYADALAQRPLDEVVAMLNDSDFAVRELAERRLLADDTITHDKIKSMLRQAGTDEQRFRLIRVAEHHVMREVREAEFGGPQLNDNGFRVRQSASVGFSYQPILPEDNDLTRTAAVAVTSTMPGFPGHVLLRSSDLVIAVDGQTFPGYRDRWDVTTWMKERIGMHQPGDTIELTVLRDGKALSISMVCAQGEALQAMYSTNAFDSAYRERLYEEKWLAARQDLTADLPGPAVLKPAP